MKFAFSTLGCPEWSWDDMVSTAKDLGFDGIEVRGIENELFVPKAKPFLPTNIEHTKARLAKVGLEIPCLTSSCYLFEKSKINHYIEEGKQYIDIAKEIGTSYVRVLGDRNPEPGEGVDIGFVVENLSVLAEYAGSRNVKVLIETNGVFAKSEVMQKAIQRTGSSNIGVLWDIHHPYRYYGEPVKETYEALKQYIEYVHVKDSVVADGRVKYKMMGYGDVPVKETLLNLKESGFKGYVSLEWVKRWCADLEDPGIVFSHFINYAKDAVV
ncbi:MAG: sugar phosphate isomerase/epimerase [Clostridia bacterium]|nr:sugar phosphate isomerase/epimerase [Clostridia bacterium]